MDATDITIAVVLLLLVVVCYGGTFLAVYFMARDGGAGLHEPRDRR